ncbi:MAG: 50S ribosomal protein L5 [Candidatus Hodarchaeota archaeon]
MSTKKTTTTKPKTSSQKTASTPTKTTTPQPSKPDVAEKVKAKKNNVMRKIFISKVVVNMSLGAGGEPLAKAKTVLEELTGQKPADVLAKRTNRDFGLRKGEPMGCKVTLRGAPAKDFVKRALDVKDFRIPQSAVDQAGNVSFGISEHIQIPGAKYDPNLGIFGMDVCICTERPGFRINRRRRARHKIPLRHRITPEEAMTLLSTELGVQFTLPDQEDEY